MKGDGVSLRIWKIKRLVEFATRVALREMERAQKRKPVQEVKVKVDVVSLLKDLGSGDANPHIHHFYARNHRFAAMIGERNRRAAVDTHDFVDAEMPRAMFVMNQMQIIKSRREEIMKTGGYILDLGVYKGGSTRALASIFANEHIHGFDSFVGLPEDWGDSTKGSFDVGGVLPKMPANVTLYPGWFDDTLPVWIANNHAKQISLLRVDCDIYSSTKTIFNVLKPLIKEGTWIVFDELIGYRGFRDHELKAFNEFIAETGFEYEYVAYGLTYAICYLKAPAKVS